MLRKGKKTHTINASELLQRLEYSRERDEQQPA